jgi:hypothetical protein
MPPIFPSNPNVGDIFPSDGTLFNNDTPLDPTDDIRFRYNGTTWEVFPKKINFPSEDLVANETTYENAGRRWKWDGVSWNVDNSFTLPSIPSGIPQAKVTGLAAELVEKAFRQQVTAFTLLAASWTVAADGIQTIEINDVNITADEVSTLWLSPTATQAQYYAFKDSSIVLNRCISGKLIVKAYQKKPIINIPIVYYRGVKKKTI